MNRPAHRRTLSLAAATLALALFLAGNDRMHCAPIPVEPACAAAGEYVHPWDPTGPVCCPGLQSATPMERDPVTDECQALVGGAVCIDCGDGVCGAGENGCVCPEDCAPTCVPVGALVWPWDPTGPDCCVGLVASPITEIDPATGECVDLDGAMQCLACGDGACGEGEDRCSCPADCDVDCVPAGGYVFPWDPSYGVCCPGLHTAGTYEIDANGECHELVGGALCIDCGDGACGAGENACNCAADCAEGCGGLPEDACGARDGCQPGYRGFCDCTCPGPPGYEGGGCPACGSDCFVYAACVTVD